MIINYTKKGHSDSFLRLGLKNILRFFPASFPTKIYHAVSVFPPLKRAAHLFIRSFIPESISIEEGIISLNQKDVTVSGALALGAFEKREIETFRKSLKENMVVVDIGANIGLYSVIAGHRVGPNGKVFAYEPEEENFSILKKNIEINKRKNTTLLQTALSDKKESRFLYLAKDNKGHHSFAKDSSAITPIKITTDTLDASLEGFGSPLVDIIKIDIEGAEPLAIKGMSKTISRNPNIIIFTEIYPNAIRRLNHDPIEFLKLLNSHGLSIWIIHEDIEPERLMPDDFESYIKNFKSGESFHNLYASRKPLNN